MWFFFYQNVICTIGTNRIEEKFTENPGICAEQSIADTTKIVPFKF